MSESNSQHSTLIGLLRKAMLTTVATLQNRGELFFVELQEEKNRTLESIIWVAAAFFLAIMFLGTFTATVIWLFPADMRIYAAIGFCVLYLAGTILALLNLKALIKDAPPPFSETITEVRKDREWLESLK
jgi:uncharacterized membrane protein YqjE